jgi:hypothetical protein
MTLAVIATITAHRTSDAMMAARLAAGDSAARRRELTMVTLASGMGG